jgi:hypothetical protein
MEVVHLVAGQGHDVRLEQLVLAQADRAGGLGEGRTVFFRFQSWKGNWGRTGQALQSEGWNFSIKYAFFIFGDFIIGINIIIFIYNSTYI